MKQGHSGKIRFYLNVITGEVKGDFSGGFNKEVTQNQAYVSIGMFYTFASFNSSFNEVESLWEVYRGSCLIAKIFEHSPYCNIEPLYFEKIIAKRVTDKLKRVN